MHYQQSPSDEIFASSRAALLDALEALHEHRNAVIVVGAQAVYLHTGKVKIALAEMTRDSDVSLDPRLLGDSPRIEDAMTSAGFTRASGQEPGAWVNRHNIPVDVMVPERLAGRGRRSAEIPPHDKLAVRRSVGLEAALVDHQTMTISEIDKEETPRTITARVAGPAALIVTKTFKIHDRLASPHRHRDKDAHDIYRLLRAVDTDNLAQRFRLLADNDLSRDVAESALTWFQTLFADGPHAPGSAMAGRAEEGLGDPEQVALSTAFLAEDLLSLI